VDVVDVGQYHPQQNYAANINDKHWQHGHLDILGVVLAKWHNHQYMRLLAKWHNLQDMRLQS
jgi:hypothetical protein